MTSTGHTDPAAGSGLVDAALRAMAHPRRRAMLRVVRDGERTARELAEAAGTSPPDASRHLKILREAGLLTVRAEKTSRLYRLDPIQMAEVRAVLDEFWDDRLAALKVAAETMAAERPAQQDTA
ncbi:ArsR/SmtB family transcription factor [Salinispora arenicola]|uniref:ArsR/SmtB family transcription factor n=1 Tax=Salinispora arenicola TaxID=168697 RepID=UPI00037570CF|nr:metalloregulator ArsR/SmtB family transcription factor [Salinispora arenicola]NIL63482.1 winged helix-turn-helix transcriptional regulator [Salinispora arenicola]